MSSRAVDPDPKDPPERLLSNFETFLDTFQTFAGREINSIHRHKEPLEQKSIL